MQSGPVNFFLMLCGSWEQSDVAFSQGQTEKVIGRERPRVFWTGPVSITFSLSLHTRYMDTCDQEINLVGYQTSNFRWVLSNYNTLTSFLCAIIACTQTSPIHEYRCFSSTHTVSVSGRDSAKYLYTLL